MKITVIFLFVPLASFFFKLIGQPSVIRSVFNTLHFTPYTFTLYKASSFIVSFPGRSEAVITILSPLNEGLSAVAV